MLEKLAPTFLAGMPAIVKPATVTSFVTERMVRAMIESGILPEGALQLIVGGVGDLFEHLDCQDVVTFTGSAKTGQMLKTHHAITENSVRFNMEADSLNFSMLAPDAAPGTDEFDLFVKEVVREMTSKTGQKCTAIRRTIVPEAMVGDLIEAVKKRLAGVKIGDPSTEGVKMGPLAGRTQVGEVGRSLDTLLSATERVYGDPNNFDVIGADRTKGAFFPTTAAVLQRSTGAHRAAQRRGVRTGEHGDAVQLDGRSDRAGEDGPRESRRLAVHRERRDRARCGTRRRGISRPPDGSQPSQRQGVDRPRLAAPAAGARRAGSRRRRRGDGRNPRCAALHAAHGGAGIAADTHTHRERMGARRIGAVGQSASIQEVLRRARDRRDASHASSYGHRSRHRQLRGRERRQLLRAHWTTSRRRTHCSARASRTDTSSCQPLQDCSSIRRPDRCSPTTAWKVCDS